VPALRVLLDTNVLLSGIAYPASVPGKILAAWRHGAIDVLLSDCILEELRRVLPRLAHRCVLRPMTDRIPDRWRTPFRWHGGQCAGQMADGFGVGPEGCPP
jgi:hypothetical protein